MRFFRSDSGYALVLTLLFMPVFIGMSLLVIDISRGNNAHSDLQAAADALALAGARELDGGVDSIDRAIEAMQEISNTVSFLGRTDEDASIRLTFGVEGDPVAFEVRFLTELPENDDDPVDLSACVTHPSSTCDSPVENTDQTTARFVNVRAQSRDLGPFFGLFFDGVNPVVNVPIAAVAVAAYREVACEAPPMFVCNPLAGNLTYSSVSEAFNAGWFHARLFRLRDNSNSGNFGFLNLGDLLGVGNLTNPTFRQDILPANQTLDSCGVTLDSLETRTGQITSFNDEYNTRFGLYRQNPLTAYASDVVVRKGFIMESNGCRGEIDPTFRDYLLNASSIDPALFSIDSTDGSWTYNGFNLAAMGYPANYTMPEPLDGVVIGGASVTDGNDHIWPVEDYLRFNYPAEADDILAEIVPQSYAAGDDVANPNIDTPSRHDVYLYEVANRNTLGDVTDPDPLEASCTAAPTVDEGRIMYLAIGDCSGGLTGGSLPIEVITYARVFLTNPVTGPSDPAITFEVIDVTDQGAGTTDLVFRDEAYLVR
ncbi:pilus assembly protein TadG-related protein [Seohaeicola saemankumensis]|uniref:Pilus assembly protein TadG-related protein n=1 Tax=Seohaeicola saemankumensis TaxID=481181 RepID=A0ABW3TG74_9RHOB